MDASWLVPTVVVGAIGVSVQGIKAGWDLIGSLRTHANSQNALRLQEVGALMNLVEGLPLAAARKAVWKVNLVKLIQRKAPLADIYLSLERLIHEAVGEVPPAD